MSDTSPPRRDSGILPPPTIYDPADDHETPPGTEPRGPVVLLLVAEGDPRWAARTAVELCSAWGRGGRRIVLADLHLENPVLHESTGEENLEGVVDVFYYGASIARSARPVAGHAFHLIPAGTYTDDVEGIYHHPRWPKLVAGFRDADASLVLFAPADGADLGALARWVSEAVIVGQLRDPSSIAPLTGAGIPLRAHIVQPTDGPSVREAPRPVFVPQSAPATPSAPPPASESAFDEPSELHLPPPPVRPRPSRRPIYLGLAFLTALALLFLLGYVVARRRPDLLPWPAIFASGAADTTLPTVDPVLAVPAPPVRGGDPLPYSVQVIAFQSLPAALERLARDRERVAGAPVFVSPEEIGGIVYYRILAGALADSAAARALREELVAGNVVDEEDAAGSWTLIQSAPLAFALSEYPSREAATAAADSLLTRNIPAYAIAVPYSDSTQRWQLYAGAYRDTASAAPMRALLGSAGLTPALVTRTGLAPARDGG